MLKRKEQYLRKGSSTEALLEVFLKKFMLIR